MTYAPQFPPATPMRNSFGTTALVLGIVGAVFAFIPIIGVVAWPLVILGLIFGIFGILRTRSGKADNRGMAIAGTALSGVGLVVCIAWTVALGATASEYNKTLDQFTAPGATTLGAAPGVPPMPGQSVEAAAADGSSIPGNGTFVVGSDIQPGTYKTDGPDSFGCTYFRLANTSGDFNAIITSNVTQGPATVTIADSDGAFQTSGCKTWAKVN